MKHFYQPITIFLYTFFATLTRGFVIVSVALLLYGDCSHKCFAKQTDITQFVNVPFTAAQSDAFFQPHQLVTIELRKDELSPAIPATFLFDTGSTHCAISASMAAKLGLPLHPLEDRFGNTLSLDGKSALNSITLYQLSIGSFQVQYVPINVLPDEKLTHVLGQHIDGILGTDILRSLGVCLDFTNSQLTFITPPMPSPYSMLPSSAVSLAPSEIRHLGFDKALAVPLHHDDLYNYSALFQMSNGTKMQTQSLLIDSGTPATALLESITDSLGLPVILSANYRSMDDFGVNVFWLPNMKCADLTLNDLAIASPSQYAQGFVPRLGLDVLANYDILFDFPHQRMYLKPRLDLQAVTSRQYEAASTVQRQQWSQQQLIITYPTVTGNYGFVIPYELTSDGLPLAQVRPDLVTPSVPFLLKSNTKNTVMSDTLAQKWRMNAQVVLDDAGKPRSQGGQIVRLATVSNLHIAGSLAHGQIGIFPAEWLLPRTSYLPLQGVVGANIIFDFPLLMDPTLQTWTQLAGLAPEDLPSLGMADAAVIDILDPDGDGIPAIAVQMQRGLAQFTETSTLATGSAFTLLSAQAAQALKLTAEPQKLRYGTGKDLTVFNQAHLSQITIGGVVLKDVQVAYPDGAMPDGFYPRLGMNVISRLRLLVDAPAKKMYVKYAGG